MYFDDGDTMTTAATPDTPIVDTGSSALLVLTEESLINANCNIPNVDALRPNQVKTPVDGSSSLCSSLIYAEPSRSGNGACTFRIVYADGSIETRGVYEYENITFSPSFAIQNSSEYGDQSMKTNSTPALTQDGTIVGVVNATNSCSLYPGVMGLDRGDVSVLSQMAASGTVDKLALGICAVDSRKQSLMVFGGSLPDVAATVQQVPLYAGDTLPKLTSASINYTVSLDLLARPGLSDHYYVVVESIVVGSDIGASITTSSTTSSSTEGPFAAIVDTGRTMSAVPASVYGYIMEIVAQNAENSPVAQPYSNGCFAFTDISSALPIVRSIVPDITFTMSDGVAIVLASEKLVTLQQLGPEWVGCVTLESSSQDYQEVAFGMNFFMNRFVQLDSVDNVMRMFPVNNSCEFSSWQSTGVDPPSSSAGYMQNVVVACVTVLLVTYGCWFMSTMR